MRSNQRKLVSYQNLLLTRRFFPWRAIAGEVAALRDAIQHEVLRMLSDPTPVPHPIPYIEVGVYIER